jgi:hypothetical protein
VESCENVPQNARPNAVGFRFYDWPGGDTDLHRQYGADKPATVISVTAARSVVGTPYQLVTWQINNVLNLATGQRRTEWRDYSKSKRGRLVRGYKKDGPFPGEFVTRMLDSEGDEDKVREVREWLKLSAEEPRDVAAVRGSVVHKMIEMRVPMSQISEDIIRWYFDEQWAKENRKVYPTVTDEDVDFVGNGMMNYWDMREQRPFVIIAQEPQVWNLTVGYAGSADVLMWFLPESEAGNIKLWQDRANRGAITIETIGEVGGELGLGDWKTSPDVYTGHVVQGTAYLAAEFVGQGNRIDDRLTKILKATMRGLLIKIRPDGWEIDKFRWRDDVSYAFFGEIALARFLLTNEYPGQLFDETMSGQAERNWR